MSSDPVSRREAVSRLAYGAAGLTLGCALGDSVEFAPVSNGRLTARPRSDLGSPNPGLTPLLIRSGRDGVLYVPAGLPADQPVPLIVLFHGAGGSGRGMEELMQPIADESGCVILVPDSAGTTWDVIRDDYGPDVAYVDQALGKVFSMFSVDPNRIAVGGFSDGGTYALGLGRINGDLFKRVLAFSPGFMPPGVPVGKPMVYISHGHNDQILPLELTSRVIVANLTTDGYDVTFREFQGGHVMSAALLREAFGLVAGAGGG